MFFIEVFPVLFLIFESIGTAELGLIMIVALILLGPRRMPFYAKKVGKTINDFKRATNDFKQTWEKEAGMSAFEEEIEKENTVSRQPTNNSSNLINQTNLAEIENNFANQNLLPTVKEVDPVSFADSFETIEEKSESTDTMRSKRSWL